MSAEHERSLPHNLDAERSVLGAILLHNDAFDIAARHVNAADFFRDAHRRIYLAMATLLERPGGACDFTTLREELIRSGDLEEVGGAVYLAGLADGMPRSTNVRHYAGIVKDKAVLRALIFTGNKIVSAGYEGDQDAETILGDADAALLDLRRGRRASNVHVIAQRTSALITVLEERAANRGRLLGVPTGWDSIDKMTMGWRPGNLIIVAARPSIGKSGLALGSARACCESLRPDGSKRRVLMFSMEMTKEELEVRLLSQLSGINSVKLEGGFLAGSDWANMTAGLERMGELEIHIDDTPSRTVADIRAEARQMVADGGLDLITVDYVQLMKSSEATRRANRNEQLGEISRDLKVLAGELGVPVMALAQLKRIQGRPKLDDLRDSGALEQEANQVALLHRVDHREGGPTAFILAKNRNGPTGEETLTFVKECARFDDGGEPVPHDPVADATAERTTKRRRTHARRAAGMAFSSGD
mgnify:CR=1 FL=1